MRVMARSEARKDRGRAVTRGAAREATRLREASILGRVVRGVRSCVRREVKATEASVIKMCW